MPGCISDIFKWRFEGPSAFPWGRSAAAGAGAAARRSPSGPCRRRLLPKGRRASPALLLPGGGGHRAEPAHRRWHRRQGAGCRCLLSPPSRFPCWLKAELSAPCAHREQETQERYAGQPKHYAVKSEGPNSLGSSAAGAVSAALPDDVSEYISKLFKILCGFALLCFVFYRLLTAALVWHVVVLPLQRNSPPSVLLKGALR